MTTTGTPIGELVHIADDDIEIEVLPAIGARLHRLRVFGHDLLRTPGDLARHVDDSWFWGCYPMAPWCNRFPAGPTTIGGRDIHLATNFPDGTAIHGQVARAPWKDAGDGVFTIDAGGGGWPWRYAVEQRVALKHGAVTIALRLTNLSDTAMPAGLGIHPWFRQPVNVAIRAGFVHPTNIDSEPAAMPVDGDLDRRAREPMPAGVDATWTGLESPAVLLEWPRTGIRATLDAGPAAPFIVAAAPPELDAIAVEPQTHGPDGARRFELGEPGAPSPLEPGAVLQLTTVLAFERLEASGQT